jgi:hypothetical protein
LIAAAVAAVAVAKGNLRQKREQRVPASWELLESVDWESSADRLVL